MAYNRPLVAGTGLTQSPCSGPGVFETLLDSNIASVYELGVVQVGSGLSITSAGVLSTTSGTGGVINVKLVSDDYTATATDYYIGATDDDLDVTLPLGVTGKVYIVKNQHSGSIKVKASGGQKIDTSSFKTLGSESSITVVFDGTRWNVIE